MSEDVKNRVKQTFIDLISDKQEIIANESYRVLVVAGDVISNFISNDGKLLICVNGGSAADAQNLTAGFPFRLASEVNRGSIPALSLVQDTSTPSAFNVLGKVTARIQESHITAGHALLQYVEDYLMQNGWLNKE